MVQALNNLWVALVVYLLATTGSALLIVKLSSVVADQVVVLAQPYLDNSPPKVSLIEQRRIDAPLADPPLAKQERTQAAGLDAHPVPPPIMAARLDLAEKENLELAPGVASESGGVFKADSQPSSIATRVAKHRIARSNSRYAAVTTTRDIFNRSFGVFTVAAN
jgi:hypothetical protein